MPDVLEKHGQSLLQHGSLNDRVYLMKYAEQDHPELLDVVDDLCAEHGYGKVFAKTRSFARSELENRGYRLEARIPGFYNGREDALFWGRYLDENRARDVRAAETRQVLEAARSKAATALAPKDPNGMILRPATPADADGIASVYTEIFETYPFPIHDPAYLREVMGQNFVFFVAEENGSVVAVASCEMDESGGNVEMTDFASRHSIQGRGVASALLARMEQAMAERGLATAYTIARAYSYGMNITFAKLGYTFSGTLINNTNIGGAIESMNVWYKRLGG